MWVDEAIWGHRFYNEQLPWMVFLEFLNVFHYEDGKDRAFEEAGGLNTLKYRAAHRLHLRNILFNNPHLLLLFTSRLVARAKDTISQKSSKVWKCSRK